MKKKQNNKNNDTSGGNEDRHAKNAGSSGFNQGSEQDPDYDKGITISDEEKKTGHTPSPLRKRKQKY